MIQKVPPRHFNIWLIVLLFISIQFNGYAQVRNFSSEVKFVQYLQDKELFKESKFILDKIGSSELSGAQRDTFFFLTGWGAYLAKQLDTSVYYLLKVSPSYSLYNKSQFFSAYNLAYLARPDSSKQTLSSLALTDSVEKEMRVFQLAGLALLKRDFTAFKALQGEFTYSYFAFQREEQRLQSYHEKLSSYHKKSPLLAGIYSAVLPGAGKFYAGKKKQGIASFLPIASLGLVAYEAYRKGGVGSARFIAFGSLFSVFYVGNIWGSVLSVKIKQKEFYREYDNKILFDMHIPLRNLYN